MINVIVELSKYIILTLMIVYTFHCFYTVRQSDEEDRNELLRQQLLLIFFIDFTAFLVLYLKTFNFKIVEFYAEMLLFFAAIQILYRLLYKKASILLLNIFSTETTSDRSRRQCYCSGHSCHDPEDAFSSQTYMGICRNRYYSSCCSLCSCKNELWS